MRLLALITASLLLLGALPAAASSNNVDPASLTFHKDVQSILQRNCQSCHRAEGVVLGGMIAPMSLTTYEEIRPWARSIAKQVQSRSMPPWFADEKFHGVFSTERTLTDEEIETVVAWARNGAPKGDPADAPPPLDTSGIVDGWTIGKPDLVLSLAEPFFVDDDVRDLNITLPAEFITEEMMPEPRYIEAIEFRAGSNIVHHIVGSKNAQEAETPGATGLLAGLAPGTEPFALPEGYGRLLTPNTQIYLNMHYNKEPGEDTGRWDRSQVAIKFKPKTETIEHIAQWEGIGNQDFEIPPNTEDWKVGASKIFRHDATIFGFIPHMHLRGRYAKYEAFYPDGTREVLLEVPWYDWNWQTNYLYNDPKRIPAGTRVEVTMWYDNTKEREEIIKGQGTDITADRAVSWGGPTYEEMMIGFIDYAYEVPLNHEANNPDFGTGGGGGQ
ncbi:MAG: hypothetical protein AAF690_27430 [Acidobacteriota bacterium]